MWGTEAAKPCGGAPCEGEGLRTDQARRGPAMDGRPFSLSQDGESKTPGRSPSRRGAAIKHSRAAASFPEGRRNQERRHWAPARAAHHARAVRFTRESTRAQSVSRACSSSARVSVPLIPEPADGLAARRLGRVQSRGALASSATCGTERRGRIRPEGGRLQSAVFAKAAGRLENPRPRRARAGAQP